MGDRTDRRARLRGKFAAAAAAVGLVVTPGTAHAAKLRAAGVASLVTVDGPARVTIKTKQRTLKLRIYGVDSPEAGECGAAEGVAALRKLVTKRTRAYRYRLADLERGGFERDPDGRYLAWLGRRGQDPVWDGLGSKLVRSGWARSGDPLAPGERASTGGSWSGGYPSGDGTEIGPAARGLWAACGGRAHLPVGQGTPPHAAAPWTVTPDGITTGIGPLTLPSTLAPGRALTMAAVAAVAAVELAAFDERSCTAHVPSLELVVWASTPAGGEPCSQADVAGIATSGPGPWVTSRGWGEGAKARTALALFPRLIDPGGEVCEGHLELAGTALRPWAWQTTARVGDDCTVVGLSTTVAPEEE